MPRSAAHIRPSILSLRAQLLGERAADLRDLAPLEAWIEHTDAPQLTLRLDPGSSADLPERLRGWPVLRLWAETPPRPRTGKARHGLILGAVVPDGAAPGSIRRHYLNWNTAVVMPDP